MDNGLSGLNINNQSLTPPDKLLSKIQTDQAQQVVDVNLVENAT